jgi:hypothetical protein
LKEGAQVKLHVFLITNLLMIGSLTAMDNEQKIIQELFEKKHQNAQAAKGFLEYVNKDNINAPNMGPLLRSAFGAQQASEWFDNAARERLNGNANSDNRKE